MASTYRLANASEPAKRAVWQKAKVVPNYDPAVWRYDACGAPIKYDQHGNRSSKHGWEIDHIVPVSKGGSDALTNLQPLQWENNVAKGDEARLVCVIPHRAA